MISSTVEAMEMTKIWTLIKTKTKSNPRIYRNRSRWEKQARTKANRLDRQHEAVYNRSPAYCTGDGDDPERQDNVERPTGSTVPRKGSIIGRCQPMILI